MYLIHFVPPHGKLVGQEEIKNKRQSYKDIELEMVDQTQRAKKGEIKQEDGTVYYFS